MTALLVILIATFVVRLAVRLINPSWTGPDTFLHFLMARAIRQNHRLPKEVERVTFARKYDYPFAYHWLLAQIPERFMRAAEILTGPLTDTLIVTVAYFGSRVILPSVGMSEVVAIEASLWVALITAFNPSYLIVSGGPRTYQGSPRPIGQLLFLVFGVCTILFEMQSDYIWFFVAAIAVAAGSVMSKFFNQVMLVTVVVLSAAGQWMFLATATLGYAIAFVIFRQRIIDVFYGHLAHSIFYTRLLKEPMLLRGAVGRAGYAARFAAALRAMKFSWMNLLRWVFSESSPLHVIALYYLFGALGVIVWCYAAVQGDTLSVDLLSVAVIILASVIAALASAHRWFIQFGESQRYYEYTLPFQVILTVTMLEHYVPDMLIYAAVPYLALACAAWMTACNIMAHEYKTAVSRWNNLREALAIVDQENVVLHPTAGWFWPILAQTQRLQLPFYGINNDLRAFPENIWHALYKNFPRPGTTFGRLKSEYNVTHTAGCIIDYQKYAEETGDTSFTDGSRIPQVQVGDVLIFKI